MSGHRSRPATLTAHARALVLACLLGGAAVSGTVRALAQEAASAGPTPVERAPWRFTRFPITAWFGPPGTARREDFEAYRDAGFTLHATNPDAGFHQALDHVEAVGLASLVFRQHQGFVLPALPNPAFPAHRESVVGWIVADEPSGEVEVGRSIGAVNRLLRRDPSRWAFFNLLPPQLQRDPPTETVIEAAVRAGMPIVSFDTYAIMRDGVDRAELFYGNLDRIRAASLQHGVPFWAFALTIAHHDYRRPSESDLRWQHYSNLAYGAKGLWYFTYWAPAGWTGWDTRAIVDPRDGSRTELYDPVTTLNRAVLAVGGLLRDLTSVDVVHTRPPAGQRAFPPDKHWIARVTGEDVLVGFFHASNGDPYALVVNKLHGIGKSAEETADEIALTFGERVTALEAVSWLDGVPGPVALPGGPVALRIAGGTGVLLRAEISGEE